MKRVNVDERSEDAAKDFDDLPTVLTSEEVAEVLRVGVKEVRSLVASGQLPAGRLGPRKLIRIARSAVLALLGRTAAAVAA